MGHRSNREEKLFVVLVLFFPGPTIFQGVTALHCERVVVRSAVAWSLVDESFVDECVEIQVVSAVVDFLFAVVTHSLFYNQTVRFGHIGDEIQGVALKARQPEYCDISTRVSLAGKLNVTSRVPSHGIPPETRCLP